MEVTARFVVPLALASLLTGLVQSLGTPWGLFRYYWVLAKLLLTVFATVVLLVKMELVGDAARLTAEATLSRADLRAVGVQLVVHAAGGLLVLLLPAALSVYKPRGMTPYGAEAARTARAVAVLGAAFLPASAGPQAPHDLASGRRTVQDASWRSVHADDWRPW